MSDPQGLIAEHFPRIYLWLMDAKDSIQFIAFGMTASREAVNPSDWLKIVVGVVASAWLSAYATGERTAAEVKQYAREQSEFRQEVRTFMRDQENKSEVVRERLTRVEVQHGMSGNGARR